MAERLASALDGIVAGADPTVMVDLLAEVEALDSANVRFAKLNAELERTLYQAQQDLEIANQKLAYKGSAGNAADSDLKRKLEKLGRHIIHDDATGHYAAAVAGVFEAVRALDKRFGA